MQKKALAMTKPGRVCSKFACASGTCLHTGRIKGVRLHPWALGLRWPYVFQLNLYAVVRSMPHGAACRSAAKIRRSTSQMCKGGPPGALGLRWPYFFQLNIEVEDPVPSDGLRRRRLHTFYFCIFTF